MEVVSNFLSFTLPQAVEIFAKFSWYEIGAIVLGIWFGLKFLIFTIRYLETRFTAKKLIHLQILLPKNDSKLDNEKRTDKDFHEKIGKAEQLFRALYETRDLTVYNILINRFFWRRVNFSFEFQVTNQQLSFVVICEPYYRKLVEKQITSFYPSADIKPIAPEERFEITSEGNYHNGFYLHTKKPFWYPIQTYKKIEEDPLNSITNAFDGIQKGEKAVIQMIFTPSHKKWKKIAKKKADKLFKGKIKNGFHIPIVGSILRPFFLVFQILFRGYRKGDLTSTEDTGGGYVRMVTSEEEIAKAVGEKSVQAGFTTTMRLLASAPEKHRVRDLLNSCFVAFNSFQAKGMNFFDNRRIIPINMINRHIISHNFRYRLPRLFEKKCLFSPEELASIYHFPDARYNTIPIIKWMTYKMLPPPNVLPHEGPILGKSVYRGTEKMIQFNRSDRTRHCYIIGKSGSGKSVLLWNMARQDIANGEGVCLIDPHGDLVEDVAACIPKERVKDTIIFDPSMTDRPMGLNILEAKTEAEQERASLDAMEIFIKLFGNEIFGPRIQHYFRNGCLTLMADENEGATLIDIPRLFIDEDFQKYKVAKIKNPVVRAFWENEMAQTGDREKQEMIPYFTSKFGPFVSNTTMRNIIGQTKSAFNFRECMDNQKVLLINLSKGKIGGINAQLLGLIAVSKINQAAMARADMPSKDRKDVYFYVDEFQNFATDTFASILSEARKYRLNLIMAHQYIAQLSESAGGVAIGQKDSKIRDAVFGNVGSIMSFKVGAEDAEYLAKEYAPLLSDQDILSMANYKCYAKININNTTSRPFSMQTLYDPSIKNEKILDIAKRYSSVKYGRKKEFIDAEIEARMGIDNLAKIEQMSSAEDSKQAMIDEPSIPTKKIEENRENLNQLTVENTFNTPHIFASQDQKKDIITEQESATIAKPIMLANQEADSGIATTNKSAITTTAQVARDLKK